MRRTPFTLLLLLLLLATGGCISLRAPSAPDTSPLDAPAAEGTVSATFTDMITEDPINYDITMPNPGGRFEGTTFQVNATNPNVVGSPTLHFKPEEPLNVYVARFFNVRVPAFEPIPETDVSFAASEDNTKHYFAYPVTVADQSGYLVVVFRGGDRVNLSRYTGWFVQMVAGATVTRSD